MVLQNRKQWPLLLGVASLVFILDQWTKLWVLRSLGRWDSITVIPRCFHFVHVHNQGAAFGFLAKWSHGSLVLTSVAIVAIAGIVLYYFSSAVQTRLTRLALAMILGGALGNLADRLRLGYVVDFIDWHWGNVYHWPAFNIADSAISVAVVLLLVEMFLEGRRAKR